MRNSALKAFAISLDDTPRLIEEFIGPKDIGKRVNIELEGEIDKISLYKRYFKIRRCARKIAEFYAAGRRIIQNGAYARL